MPDEVVSTEKPKQTFRGFENLDANYIYCPNDFIEVCLRHNSRVVVRLVGYLLRQTLGHLDKGGIPVKQDIRISYKDLVKYAGVSRRSIRKGLDEAVKGRFLLCVTPGVKKSRGSSGQVAQYKLRWSSEDSAYTDNKNHFDGFYAGEGHRSPIPNSFFDVVIRRETLGIIKLVGTTLRHTVGYRNQFGGRRSEAPLSYGYIHQFANLVDPTTLNESLNKAVEKGYIKCVSKGYFDKENGGKNSRAGQYAVKWLGDNTGPRPVP